MSFLDQLINKKSVLKNTTTLITRADGNQYLENSESRKLGLDPKAEGKSNYGFVVDNAPDDIPVEVIPGLYIGSQDCTDLNILTKFAIKHVLSLGIKVDLCQIDNLYIPCLDLPETNITNVLYESNSFIKGALDKNESVLIHCNAGVSRTSMVAIGFLILENSMLFTDAYNLVKMKRPCIQPNAGFVKQLKLLKETRLQ